MEVEGNIEDYSCDIFETDEIHKIAILDLRIMNLDRNEGNILVQAIEDPNIDEYSLDINNLDIRKDPNMKRRLVPIDHGMSIPENLEVCSFDLVWLSFSHAERPFS